MTYEKYLKSHRKWNKELLSWELLPVGVLLGTGFEALLIGLNIKITVWILVSVFWYLVSLTLCCIQYTCSETTQGYVVAGLGFTYIFLNLFAFGLNNIVLLIDFILSVAKRLKYLGKMCLPILIIVLSIQSMQSEKIEFSICWTRYL